MPPKSSTPIDMMSEHAHQKALFAWSFLAAGQRPDLAGMYAVPNAGKRSITGAAYMKAEGLKSGVPDICLPAPRGAYGALYIELKSAKGKASDKQSEWIERLGRMGNRAVVCKGWLAAKSEIENYLDGRLND